MLEVLAIIGLCKLNRKNAIARGKRPGGFIALTIVLWIVMEIIGMIIGIIVAGSLSNGDMSDETSFKFIAMIFGIGFAGLGGLISFLCAKFGPKGDYVDPSIAVNPQYSAPVYVPGNTPAYMAPTQPAQPQEYVHVDNPYQAPATPAQSTQYCEFCGEPLKPGAKFCASCGTKINFPVGE